MTKYLREELYKIMDLSPTDSPNYLIAKEILKSLNNDIKLNSTKIAKDAYTSKPTVTRFAQHLGFQGFKEFERELVSQDKNYYFNTSIKSYHDSFEEYSSALKRIIRFFDVEEERLIEIAKLIKEKGKVFVFCSPDTTDIANNFSDRLKFIGIDVINANTKQFFLVNTLKENDLAFFLIAGMDIGIMPKLWRFLKHLAIRVLICSPTFFSKFENPSFAFNLNIDQNVLHLQLKQFTMQYILDQIFNLLISTDQHLIDQMIQPRYRF